MAEVERGRSTVAAAFRRRRRGSLDRDALVEAAATVAARGVAGLTMAAVAGELGVTAMALYSHVEDKQHLLTLLMDSMLAAVEVPSRSVGSWDVRLRQLHLEVTAAMSRYPGLVSEVGELAEVPRLLDGYLQILLDGGFSAADAGRAYTGLYYLAMGAQHPYRDASTTPAAVAPADPKTHAATARTARALKKTHVDELQTFALDIYLDGLRWELERLG